MMIRLLTLLILTLTTCFAQQPNFTLFETYMDQLADQDKFMGSVAIMKNGELSYTHTVGFSNSLDGKITKSTQASTYRIGSITKMFTAVMILQLVDEQRLRLTDTLAKFYPQIPNANVITIEHLLNHSSGLFNITRDADFARWSLQPSTQAQMLSRIQQHPADFYPGDDQAYSNTNYILLGYLLEKIEQTAYQDLLQKRIAQKLKLSNTYVGGAINVNANECQSYYKEDGSWMLAKETDMSNPGGAGALVSNPIDLVQFFSGLFSNRLLSEASFTKMITPVGEFGLGIFKSERNGEIIYGHNGSIDAFNAFMIYLPSTTTSIAITANASSLSLNTIMFNALDAAQGKSFDLPVTTSISLTEEEAKAYEGVYVHDELPFDLYIVAEGTSVMAGPSLTELNVLTATKKGEFNLEARGIRLVFNEEKTSLQFSEPSMGSPQVFIKK